MTCKERLIRTIKGEEVDRIATFDIMHNLDLIEHLAEAQLTPRNAEDLLCKAANKVLDLVRHFAVPDDLEPKIFKDETGFVYHYEWWTGHVVERPEFDSSEDVEHAAQKDIEIIYDCIQQGKICHLARQHVRLFDESFETFEEVKSEFRRVSEKLEGTIMLAPEDLAAVGVATERYDETGWWYLWYDYPETAARYLDALTDYHLAFIDAFADASVSPFAQISVPTGTYSGLLYPPAFMKEEVISREKKKVERWKKHGYYVLCFLDGYKWPLIDDFLSIGVDEIHPCEPYCQMDVKTFREKYPEVPISQPIDCVHLLPFGSEAEVRDAVVRAIEDAGKRKIIIGSTSEVHPAVNVKNVLVMYDTARNYPL